MTTKLMGKSSTLMIVIHELVVFIIHEYGQREEVSGKLTYTALHPFAK